MLKKTQLLKAKLEESRNTGYTTTISPLRPGQESIMVVRPWGPGKNVREARSSKLTKQAS